MLTLGEFETDSFSSGSGTNLEIVWILFALATFLSQITILNMLIAIMGDTFDSVSETRQQSGLAEKIYILNDYVWVVQLKGKNQGERKFFFAAYPTTVNKNEGKTWDGKISAIKNLVEDGLAEQRKTFVKKFSFVEK